MDGVERTPLVPVPHKLRGKVNEDDVKELWARDSLSKAESKDEKILALSQWSISYYKSHMILLDVVEELHGEVKKFSEALFIFKLKIYISLCAEYPRGEIHRSSRQQVS